MKAVFISNYINHHQIPFSDALYDRMGDGFHFIQTQPMEASRVEMGWAVDEKRIPYVVNALEEETLCRSLIDGADLLLAGWTERTDLFSQRLGSGKLTLRISERLYREGQWKAVSPRGLAAKYREHIRFRKQPVYLLCAGAYVASDFSLIHAYPDKMYRFGYFPELKVYDEEELFAGKGREGALQMVWAGRMIALKHPEFAVRLAKELKREGHAFHIHLIGSGPLEEEIRKSIVLAGLTENFTLYGFLPPAGVREVMEKCHIYLFTSSYLEGWGAVVNEAMNSGCCTVANAQAGAVPYLIEDRVNGVSYQDGGYDGFARRVKDLLKDREAIERMGRAAYRTILNDWNAGRAAQECVRFYENWRDGRVEPPESGPFSKAPLLKAGFRYNEGSLE